MNDNDVEKKVDEMMGDDTKAMHEAWAKLEKALRMVAGERDDKNLLKILESAFHSGWASGSKYSMETVMKGLEAVIGTA